MTALQLTLPEPADAPASLEDAFLAWRATPDGAAVYAMVRRLALVMRRRGYAHYGIGALWETARYRLDLGRPGDPYRLNNNWRSRMARELMRREPDLAGFFELRELKA